MPMSCFQKNDVSSVVMTTRHHLHQEQPLICLNRVHNGADIYLFKSPSMIVREGYRQGFHQLVTMAVMVLTVTVVVGVVHGAWLFWGSIAYLYLFKRDLRSETSI